VAGALIRRHLDIASLDQKGVCRIRTAVAITRLCVTIACEKQVALIRPLQRRIRRGNESSVSYRQGHRPGPKRLPLL
jgi:hypothetical protein